MKQFFGLLLLALGLVVAVVLIYFASGKTLQMTIAKEEIDNQIQEVFPINRGLMKLDMSNAKTEFSTAENRISLSGDVNISVLGRVNATGFCKISGKPQYNPAEQAIQLKDVHIEELTLNGMSEKVHEQVVQLADKAIKLFLEDYPFYKFNRDKWLQKFIGSHVREVKTGDVGLVLTLAW